MPGTHPSGSAAAQAIEGERAAAAVIEAAAGGFAMPDALLDALGGVFAADGAAVGASPRIRGFCRAVQKAIEIAGSRMPSP